MAGSRRSGLCKAAGVSLPSSSALCRWLRMLTFELGSPREVVVFVEEPIGF